MIAKIREIMFIWFINSVLNLRKTQVLSLHYLLYGLKEKKYSTMMCGTNSIKYESK
jgi:hypothetical protein